MVGPVDDPRLAGLVGMIARLAAGDLSARLPVSPARDAVDAVITGINLLAEELDVMYRTLEQQVADRTAELVQAHREMERLALTDGLTGLANRTLLLDRVAQAQARADRGERAPSMLLLDLDGFKTVNDGFGHDAGDRVLVEVARRLIGAVRGSDTVTRLGGDEFAVLMPDVTDEEGVLVARRILDALRAPITLGRSPVWVGASIGLCPGVRGYDAERLLRDADTAMYAAKADGRGNVQVFRPELHRAARERLWVAAELASAITGGQLRLHYQPIVELATGRVMAVEALVRWAHPTRGLLLPGEFIPAAADSGQLIEVGHWVLQEVIGQLAGWQDRAPAGFQVHVNLAPAEIRWPGLVPFIKDTLDRYRVDPQRLAVEISETTRFHADDIAGLDALHALRGWGVGVGIDDFGAGYSAISYLRRLPIDTVKVDQSLIRHITTDPRQARFLGAVLQLIGSVGLRAVVEGIETTTQRDHLLDLGCTHGQGYLFGHPMPADRITHLLTQPRPHPTPHRPPQRPVTLSASPKTNN